MTLGIKSAALGLALALLFVQAATADPRLDEKVYDPYVHNHIFEIETRAASESGGPLAGAVAYIGELEYGVSDHLSLSLVNKVAGGAGEPTRLRGVGVEAVDYLGQIPGLGIDVGLYGEYMAGLGGDDSGLEAKLLLAKQAGPVEALLNLIVERPIHVPGQEFATYGYAGAVNWRAGGNLKLGIQAFGDLGDDHGGFSRPQVAYVGPAIFWEGRPRRSPVEVELGLSWLKAFGADRHEGDRQVRVTLEFERRF